MLARQGADQLGMEVGRGIRQAVKAENPQAYLMGENFFDATSQLQGDCWDGVMNYSGFALPLGDWLGAAMVFVPGQSQPINTGISLDYTSPGGKLGCFQGCYSLGRLLASNIT